MANKEPSPLQASFWLTREEILYILVICALFLFGLTARYFYLKNQNPKVYTPAGIEQSEPIHE